MSREIDLTKKLSEDDLRYLVDRDMWDALRENAANLGLPEPNVPSARGIRAQVPRKQIQYDDALAKIAKQMKVSVSRASDDEDGDGSAQGGGESDARVNYEKMTVPQLKEEMDKRRAEYQAGDDAEGVELMTYHSDAKKGDLVAALALDDQAEPDENPDGND